ncbi:MAG: hypothetical protein ACKO13_07830, partial [Cytophagales bacterium]
MPEGIPGSSCGGNTVAPRAISETEGIFKWYDMETGGTSLRESPKTQSDSFTPNPLPSLTTNYYVSITDDNGCESSTRKLVPFSIDGDPAITPTVTPAARCGAGFVTLSASAAQSGTFRWYDKADNSGLLVRSTQGSTDSYTTPDITESTDFYVTFTDDARGCVSTSQSVTATVSSPPSAPSTVPANRCGTGSVSLSASSTLGGTFKWYLGVTGGEPLQTNSDVSSSTYNPDITSTTTFYVTFSNAGCESSPRTPVVATVNVRPSEPSEVIPGSSCGGNTVAPRAFNATEGIFKWYDTQTGGTSLQTSQKTQSDSFTPAPLPSLTTNYYVSITDDNGCESSTRKLVPFSVDGVPAITPTVTPAARCEAGSVTLSASATESGTFRWYDKADNSGLLVRSTQGSTDNYNTPDITQSTNFYVTFTDDARGCVSAIKTVTATVSSPPSELNLDPATRCGTGSVSLKASSSLAGTFKWYSAETGGSPLWTEIGVSLSTYNPSVTGTTTFYVTFSNACGESSPRKSVVATVNGLEPSIVPGSSCGG